MSAREKIPTAKFWFFHAGWVRIRLRHGKSVELLMAGPTEEGYMEERIRWSHDGDRVTRKWSSDGHDCDGRFSTLCVAECAIDQLAAETHPIHPGWPATPAWELVRRSQRDHAAEAAGY